MSFGPFDEEVVVEGNAAGRVGIKLDHPAVHAFRVELLVDGRWRNPACKARDPSLGGRLGADLES